MGWSKTTNWHTPLFYFQLSILLICFIDGFTALDSNSSPQVSRPRTATMFTNLVVYITWNVSSEQSQQNFTFRVDIQQALDVTLSPDGKEVVNAWGRAATVSPMATSNLFVFMSEREGLQPQTIYKFQVEVLDSSTDEVVARSVWSRDVSFTHIGIPVPTLVACAPISNDTLQVTWTYDGQSEFPVDSFSILVRPKQIVPNSRTNTNMYGKYRNVTVTVNLHTNNTQTTVVPVVDSAPSYQIVVLGRAWEPTRRRFTYTRKSNEFLVTAESLWTAGTAAADVSSIRVSLLLFLGNGRHLWIAASVLAVATVVALCIFIVSCIVHMCLALHHRSSNAAKHHQQDEGTSGRLMALHELDYPGPTSPSASLHNVHHQDTSKLLHLEAQQQQREVTDKDMERAASMFGLIQTFDPHPVESPLMSMCSTPPQQEIQYTLPQSSPLFPLPNPLLYGVAPPPLTSFQQPNIHEQTPHAHLGGLRGVTSSQFHNREAPSSGNSLYTLNGSGVYPPQPPSPTMTFSLPRPAYSTLPQTFYPLKTFPSPLMNPSQVMPDFSANNSTFFPINDASNVGHAFQSADARPEATRSFSPSGTRKTMRLGLRMLPGLSQSEVQPRDVTTTTGTGTTGSHAGEMHQVNGYPDVLPPDSLAQSPQSADTQSRPTSVPQQSPLDDNDDDVDPLALPPESHHMSASHL